MIDKALYTQRLSIRRFSFEDAGALYGYLSDPQVVKYEPYPPLSWPQCKEEARRRAEDPSFLAVCLKTEPFPLIGNLWISPREMEGHELGYVFARRYQGMGYATEAVQAIADYLFTQKGTHRLCAQCNPENEASWRLLERAGFRREAHHIQNVFFNCDASGAPIWQDTYVYARLAGE